VSEGFGDTFGVPDNDKMNDLNLRFERPPQKQLKRFLKTQQQKRDYDEAMDFGEHECREAFLGK